MSYKTKEEILNANVPTITFGKLIGTPKEQVFVAMDQWADQEKRNTAIAYGKWIHTNAYWMESKERWYLHRPEDWISEGRTDEELYDYYLSLPNNR